MWSKIFFNQDKGRFDNYPKRDEDVVFILVEEVYSGYFLNEMDYEHPEDSEVGFIDDNGRVFGELDIVEYWCYKSDFMDSVMDGLPNE